MWTIKQTEEFQRWFESSDNKLQDDILEHVVILKQLGPHLGRPLVDTLKGSLIVNLKELRFNSGNKVIRIFFVFDPDRSAVLIIGGDKAGSGGKKFYEKMIHKSEKNYANYLVKCKEKMEENVREIKDNSKTSNTPIKGKK
jgi:hypothetical protein